MMIIIVSVLVVIGFLIFSLIKKPMVTISVLSIIVVGILIYRLTWNFLPFAFMRQFVNHIVHLMAPPEDLYQPIIVDKFLFYEKGFTKTYSLKPKYFDNYDIGFSIGQEGIESKYKFKGKLKVEFFWKDKFLYDDLITSWDSAAYAQNDMSHFNQIALCKFGIPIDGIHTKDTSVKITVLEPDKDLERFGDLIELYIAVSPSP